MTFLPSFDTISLLWISCIKLSHKTISKSTLSSLIMDWNTESLRPFQESWALPKFWLKAQCFPRKDQYHKILYLLRPKQIEKIEIPYLWRQQWQHQAKQDMWQIWGQFLDPEHLRNYHEEVFNIKQGDSWADGHLTSQHTPEMWLFLGSNWWVQGWSIFQCH